MSPPPGAPSPFIALSSAHAGACFDAVCAAQAPHWGGAPDTPRTVTMPLALRMGRCPA